MNNVTQGRALITGASTGMGAIYADRLARRGHDLVLVARNADKLGAIADQVARATGRRVEALAADLRRAADVAVVADRLRTDPAITMLVNNAGVGASTPLLESNVEAMGEMIALKVEALMRLTYAAAPAFLDRGGGTIVNMASIVAIGPEILNGVYGGTKAFVVAFTQSLHHELGASGLRVQAVCPGAVGTDFWARTGTPLDQLPPAIVMSPANAVDAALAGLDQGEIVTLPALGDLAAWQAYEDARQALIPIISRSRPAARYHVSG